MAIEQGKIKAMLGMPAVRIVLRVLIGAVFCLSAVSKLVAIDQFELYVYSYGFVSLSVSYFVARLCIGLELVLALMMWAGWYLRLARLASLLMLVFFSLVLCYAALVGRDDSCQCFGQLVEMNPGESLLKNAVLIVVLLLFIPQGDRPRKCWEKIVSWALGVLLLVLPFVVSIPDNWGFGPQRERFGEEALQAAMSEGGELEQMGIGHGHKLVAFVTPSCPYCKLAREKLSSMARRNDIAEDNIVYVQPSDIGDSLFIAITYGARPLMLLMDGKEVKTTYHLRNVDEDEVASLLGKL
jgi:uncharacterized membrane protein YphA (DoxX/SURF4 family)